MSDTYSTANAKLTINGKEVESMDGDFCEVIDGRKYTTLPSGERVYVGDTGAMKFKNGAVVEYTVTAVD